jgi:hypothetical protein
MAGNEPANVQLMPGCLGLGWHGWRELTPDVLYWALSPGFSGGFDGTVPLPKQLRH